MVQSYGVVRNPNRFVFFFFFFGGVIYIRMVKIFGSRDPILKLPII